MKLKVVAFKLLLLVSRVDLVVPQAGLYAPRPDPLQVHYFTVLKALAPITLALTP